MEGLPECNQYQENLKVPGFLRNDKWCTAAECGALQRCNMELVGQIPMPMLYVPGPGVQQMCKTVLTQF